MPSRSENNAQTDVGFVETDDPWKVRTVEFWRVDGVILSVREKTDARVYGGGSTHVSAAYDGPVYSSEIDTEFTRYTEFWVREKSGTEVHFRIVNWDVPLRKGQRVSVLMGNAKGRSCIASICNYSANNFYINEAAYSVLHKKSIMSAILRVIGYIIIYEFGVCAIGLLCGAIGSIADIGKSVALLAAIIPVAFVIRFGNWLLDVANSRHQEVVDRIRLLSEMISAECHG